MYGKLLPVNEYRLLGSTWNVFNEYRVEETGPSEGRIVKVDPLSHEKAVDLANETQQVALFNDLASCEKNKEGALWYMSKYGFPTPDAQVRGFMLIDEFVRFSKSVSFLKMLTSRINQIANLDSLVAIERELDTMEDSGISVMVKNQIVSPWEYPLEVQNFLKASSHQSEDWKSIWIRPRIDFIWPDHLPGSIAIPKDIGIDLESDRGTFAAKFFLIRNINSLMAGSSLGGGFTYSEAGRPMEVTTGVIITKPENAIGLALLNLLSGKSKFDQCQSCGDLMTKRRGKFTCGEKCKKKRQRANGGK